MYRRICKLGVICQTWVRLHSLGTRKENSSKEMAMEMTGVLANKQRRDTRDIREHRSQAKSDPGGQKVVVMLSQWTREDVNK